MAYFISPSADRAFRHDELRTPRVAEQTHPLKLLAYRMLSSAFRDATGVNRENAAIASVSSVRVPIGVLSHYRGVSQSGAWQDHL
jgi:hypothetical protein